MLIIGIGNDDRADDAAGLLVARRLCELGIEAVENHGDVLRLIDQWAGYEHVVIVDAAVEQSGGVPRPATSSHGLSVTDAIEIAKSTGRLPGELFLIGVKAAGFAPGAPPSPEVLATVERLAQALRRAVACYLMSGATTTFAECFSNFAPQSGVTFNTEFDRAPARSLG